jgi:hypothetical protein
MKNDGALEVRDVSGWTDAGAWKCELKSATEALRLCWGLGHAGNMLVHTRATTSTGRVEIEQVSDH